MSLRDLPSLGRSLICPRCESELVATRGTYRCGSRSCVFSAPAGFPVVADCPVLIDFDRSIVRRGDLTVSPTAAAVPLTGIRRWSIDRVPSGLRSLWKPVNHVAEGNIRLLRSLLPASSPLVLVVGGGTIGNGVGALYTDQRLRVIAFDVYPSPFVQFIADAHQIPLASGSVDAVVVQAVLEHVLEPQQVVTEIHRVLKDDGLVYAETPFLQQVHAGPYDFTRYTSSGHRYLFRSFDEIAAGPVAGPGTQLLWSVDHIVRALTRSELTGKLARGLFFWLRSLDRLVSTDFAMDSAAAYFFLGRRATHTLTPHEVVDYYRGRQGKGRREPEAAG